MSDTTDGQRAAELNESDVDMKRAKADFREALLAANRTRNADGQLEKAVSTFCHGAKLLGRSPERVLVDAKQVIEETIDGDNARLAERTVSICIQQYFRE